MGGAEPRAAHPTRCPAPMFQLAATTVITVLPLVPSVEEREHLSSVCASTPKEPGSLGVAAKGGKWRLQCPFHLEREGDPGRLKPWVDDARRLCRRIGYLRQRWTRVVTASHRN